MKDDSPLMEDYQPKSDSDEIIIEFGENQRIEKLLYNSLQDNDKAIYYAGYKTSRQKSQAECQEWRDEFHRVDGEKDDLLLELSKRDKIIADMKYKEEYH